jgi:hypothetical protein
MNMQTNPIPEEHLKVVARRFHYPPTPDVAEAVMQRLTSGSRPRVQMRSAWIVASLLVLLLALLFAVPGVRAEIVRFLQVGVVRIFPATATQTIEVPIPQVPLTATPLSFPPITALPQFSATPSASQFEPLYSISISGLAGETTLEAAQGIVNFTIRLPGYPADLGAPERIFVQEDGLMVILVWLDPADPQKARLSLHEIGPGSILVGKFEPLVILETQVNGQYAVWVEGPYLVQLTDGDIDFRRTVDGNTLIWEEGGITYRLESDLSLEEAVKIAESLE